MIKAPSSVTCHGQQDARCLSFTNEAVPRSAQVTKCIASMASSDGVAGANQEASQRQRWKSSTAMTRAASQLRIRPPARPPPQCCEMQRPQRARAGARVWSTADAASCGNLRASVQSTSWRARAGGALRTEACFSVYWGAS